MSDKGKCDHDWAWYPDACTEAGWRCTMCDEKPGEPPGYSPHLDREETWRKVYGILMDAHMTSLVYVSNGTGGDILCSQVAERCHAEGAFDQCSILRFIVDDDGSRAAFWRERGEGVMSGNDKRPRCPCGALSTMMTWDKSGNEIRRCSEHSYAEDGVPW